MFGFTHKGLAFEVPTDNIHHTIKPGFRVWRFSVFDGYLHGLLATNRRLTKHFDENIKYVCYK